MENYLEPVEDGLTTRSAGPWVEEKLDYLRRYIDIFETSMKAKFSTRFFVDLLSGPGKNKIRETNKVVLGSPLIALTTRFPFSHYIFNEIENNCFEALRKRCSVSLVEKIVIFNEDCNCMVNKVINVINSENMNSLNLSFIDPEGFEVRWETIKKLTSIKRMDLIIYYPQKGLNQNLQQYYNSNETCIIDNFFGSNEWRTIYKRKLEENRLKNIHRELLDLYKENLTKLGYVEVLSSDELGIEPVIRNKKRAPLYRLLFASKNKKGAEFWEKITKRDVYGQKRLF